MIRTLSIVSNFAMSGSVRVLQAFGKIALS
jgi:hypothetical protein